MHRDELGAAGGPGLKFPTVGTTYEGDVEYVGEWAQQDFGEGPFQQLAIGLALDGGEQGTLYVRKGSQMAQAIGKALEEADEQALVAGQRLKIRYDGDQVTGKPSPMKLYRARITAAPKTAPAAASSFASDDPF